MINKVASTFRVDRPVECLANCSVSPVCDSYNYRAADKTCQLNTHDSSRERWFWCSPMIGPFRPHPLSGDWLAAMPTKRDPHSNILSTVPPTRRASSTLTTLRSLPSRPTLSTTATGAGSAVSSHNRRLNARLTSLALLRAEFTSAITLYSCCCYTFDISFFSLCVCVFILKAIKENDVQLLTSTCT